MPSGDKLTETIFKAARLCRKSKKLYSALLFSFRTNLANYHASLVRSRYGMRAYTTPTPVVGGLPSKKDELQLQLSQAVCSRVASPLLLQPMRATALNERAKKRARRRPRTFLAAESAHLLRRRHGTSRARQQQHGTLETLNGGSDDDVVMAERHATPPAREPRFLFSTGFP